MHRAVAVVLAGLLAAGCNGPRYQRQSQAAAPPPRAVRVFTLQAGADSESAGPLTGTVSAASSRALAFQLGGEVRMVSFELGDEVRAGQLLAELDNRMAAAQLSQAEGALGQAEANLALLRAGSRPEEIAAAQAQLDSARAVETQARADLERAEKLFSAGVIARAQLDQARAAATQASNAAESAAQALAIAQQGARPQQIELAAAAVTSARGAAEAARLQLEHCRLLAPADGAITLRSLEPGQIVVAGQPVGELASSGNLEVHTTVPEGGLQQIAPGQPARIEFPALPGIEATASVLRVSPQADPATRGFPLELSISGGHNQTGAAARLESGGQGLDLAGLAAVGVRPGVVAIVHIESPSTPAGLRLPRRCIVDGAVFVVVDGHVERREVQQFSSEDEYVLVSGLQAGEQVLLSGQEYVADGEAVQVVSTLGIDELTGLSTDE